MSVGDHKLTAATAALELIEPGMKLGLGSGSTSDKFVELLAAKVKSGLDVLCVPTSEATRALAEWLGIPLTTLDAEPNLDLTVDGADEIDPQLCLIKGGGGALLREKIVATASDRMVVIADASKKVATLGKFPLPIEVVRFGLASTRQMIEMIAEVGGLTGEISVRQGGKGGPFVTDNGNLILDCAFGAIPDPGELSATLKMIPGVIDHGLFIGFADIAIVAGAKGIELIVSEDEDEDEDDDDA